MPLSFCLDFPQWSIWSGLVSWNTPHVSGSPRNQTIYNITVHLRFFLSSILLQYHDHIQTNLTPTKRTAITHSAFPLLLLPLFPGQSLPNRSDLSRIFCLVFINFPALPSTTDILTSFIFLQSHLLSDLHICSFPAQNALSQALHFSALGWNTLLLERPLFTTFLRYLRLLSQNNHKPRRLQRTRIYYSWEVQDQGPSRFGFQLTLSSGFSDSIFSICPQGVNGTWAFSKVSFIKLLTASMKAECHDFIISLGSYL